MGIVGYTSPVACQFILVVDLWPSRCKSATSLAYRVSGGPIEGQPHHITPPNARRKANSLGSYAQQTRGAHVATSQPSAEQKGPTVSSPAPTARKPRLAAVISSWHHRTKSALPSHAQVIINRWLTHRDTDADWGWHGPNSEIAAIFTEQLEDSDEVHTICREHNIPLARDVDQALTLGTTKLAVDGILLIGEHGTYDVNELGQKFYPRKELFDLIVATFERTGESVPVFCDKHFSWNVDWAMQMWNTAKRMDFMLFGGSSVPHQDLSTPLPSLSADPPEEVAIVFHGDPEVAGFHAMEHVQAKVETRPGAERGVQQVTTYEGDSLAAAQRRGEWSEDLADAIFDATTQNKAANELQLTFVVDYADGLRATYLFYSGPLRNYTMAMRTKGDRKIHTTRPMMGGEENYQAHFARFSRLIEDAILNREHPFAPERTLLATCTLDRCMEQRAHPGEPCATPELAIAYTPFTSKCAAAVTIA